VVALRPEAERALPWPNGVVAEAGVVTGARAVANFAGSARAVGSLVGGLPTTVRRRSSPARPAPRSIGDDGITHVTARFGYMETPDVPGALRALDPATTEGQLRLDQASLLPIEDRAATRQDAGTVRVSP
jgi:hypothetical protein